MRYFCYDIETVPNANAPAYYAAKTYEAPSNYKDPEKIKAAVEAKRLKDMDKAALHWITGQVCCIGVTDGVKKMFFTGKDEKALLEDFIAYIGGKIDGHTEFVGKSNEFYDRPFLIGRMLAHSIFVPHWLRQRHFDIDQCFGFRSDQTSSLDNYAFGLGIQGKTASYTQVQGWFENEEWDLIEDYCSGDLDITEAMYLRYKGVEPDEN